MPPALGWTLLALVFLDELLLVAAAWVAASHVWGWPAGPLAGACVVGLWWTFASPKAPYGGPAVRPFAKAIVVLGSCASLWATGYRTAGVALLVFSIVINLLAQLPSVARLAVETDR